MYKWEILTESFLSSLNETDRKNYKELIDILVSYGYQPYKKTTKGIVMTFNNLVHNRVIANMGMRENSDKPFFGLRFSACTEYPEKFHEVVRNRILSSKRRPAKCAVCNYCGGPKHVYVYQFPDGIQADCGAFVLEIPDINEQDVEDIRKLIDIQHHYFMTYAVKEK